MNTKLVTGIAVMVLLLGFASHSGIDSASALDSKGLGNKTKTDVGQIKGASNAIKPIGIKTANNTNTVKDKTKPDLPHAMTKKEMQKINREKQVQDESAKLAKDKAKADAFVKASQAKLKTNSTGKSTIIDKNKPKK